MSGSSYLLNASIFLINLVFSVYMLVLMLRFLLQLVRADFYNPISQFLLLITNPVLMPLQRYIGRCFGIDWSPILLLVVLQVIQSCVLFLLQGYLPTAVLALAALVIAELLKLLVHIYIGAIVLQAVISLIQPGSHTPFTILLNQLTAPLFRSVRRYVPVTGNIDLSPLVILIVLNLVLILLVAPIHDWSMLNMLAQEIAIKLN